ncbi:helix-turn-helix domain-containing protein [Nocardioides pocheonensis]|nr:helix-turn-helix domain-containing protein [Nocardioides pocheonensis]
MATTETASLAAATAGPLEPASGLAGLPMLIPVPRAAQILGISRSAAYRCAACGDLPTTHLGGRVYVITAKLQELLSA